MVLADNSISKEDFRQFPTFSGKSYVLNYLICSFSPEVKMAQDEQTKEAASKKKVQTKDKEKSKSKDKPPSKVCSYIFFKLFVHFPIF